MGEDGRCREAKAMVNHSIAYMPAKLVIDSISLFWEELLEIQHRL